MCYYNEPCIGVSIYPETTHILKEMCRVCSYFLANIILNKSIGTEVLDGMGCCITSRSVTHYTKIKQHKNACQLKHIQDDRAIPVSYAVISRVLSSVKSYYFTVCSPLVEFSVLMEFKFKVSVYTNPALFRRSDNRVNYSEANNCQQTG